MPRSLDPGVRDFLDRLERLDTKSLDELTPDDARTQHRRLVEFGQGTSAAALVHRVTDANYEQIPIRIYDMSDTVPASVVVYLHGGGWVLGSLETADPCARAIAASLNCTVISVDYRLAPEYPYPAAVEDCRTVMENVTALYPFSRIAVAGDSAGANLALAMTAISLNTDAVRVDAQLLLYPALDPHQASASHDDFAEGFLLTKVDMRWFWHTYLGSDEAPAVGGHHSAVVDYSGMPVSVVTTAGFDPLQDEGRALAQQLVTANVPTTYIPHDTLVHGWMDFAGTVPAAAQARASVLAAFRKSLESTAVPRGVTQSVR